VVVSDVVPAERALLTVQVASILVDLLHRTYDIGEFRRFLEQQP
jgi:hypothetical protein